MTTFNVTSMGEQGLPEVLRTWRWDAGIQSLAPPQTHHYRYNSAGQRTWRQTGIPGDWYYNAEQHVRDGGRLVGVLDGGGQPRHWNMHAAGINPIGRIDYWLEGGTAEGFVIPGDSLELRMRAEAFDIVAESIGEAIGLKAYNVVVVAISNAAMPAAEDSLVVYLAPSIAAADSVQFSAKATVASAEFYTQSVSPLRGVMAGAFLSEGYTLADADSLGLIAGDGLAIRSAAIVADEVTKAIIDSTAQGGPTPHYDRRYYATDHLGSVRVVFDENGDVIEARDYYPLGLQIPDRVFVSGSQTREGYTGHELDPETGDYYAGARYYLPELGRWTAIDPMGQYHSPYTYVGNNPIIMVDPTGLIGDYYTKDGEHLGSDGIDDDKAYVADGVGADGGFLNAQELDVSNSTLLRFASAIADESSGDVMETFAIGSAFSNFVSTKNDSRYDLATMVSRPSNYSYGVGADRFRRFMSTFNSGGGQVPIAAAINAVSGGFDLSFGATHWDGGDLVHRNFSNSDYDNPNSHRSYGLFIPDAHLDAFNSHYQDRFGGNFVPLESRPNRDGDYGMTSTMTLGGSIFFRYFGGGSSYRQSDFLFVRYSGQRF